MDRDARKAKADSLRGHEARRAGGDRLELREVDGRLTLTGYASVTERDYDMGWYTERIRSGAFHQTLASSPDVQLLINHEGLPLARTTAGSLRLSEDSTGLRVDATLNPNDFDVQQLRMKVDDGLLDQMSFAFSGARSEWDEDYTERTITTLSIHRGDVSAVNQGANPATSFTMRSPAFVDFLERLSHPTDDDLDELRQMVSAEQRAAVFATLDNLAPSELPPPDVAPVRLDLYRARAHALALRARS